MRILVCGGREYDRADVVNDALDEQLEVFREIVVIQGGAEGADKLARWWAKAKQQDCMTYAAKWDKHGKAAGPIRNQRMIDDGKPILAVCFPGGKGTASMKRLLKDHDIPYIEYE